VFNAPWSYRKVPTLWENCVNQHMKTQTMIITHLFPTSSNKVRFAAKLEQLCPLTWWSAETKSVGWFYGHIHNQGHRGCIHSETKAWHMGYCKLQNIFNPLVLASQVRDHAPPRVSYPPTIKSHNTRTPKSTNECTHKNSKINSIYFSCINMLVNCPRTKH